MNETSERNIVKHAFDCLQEDAVRKKTLRPVAEDVLRCFELSACRSMALGIAELLSNLDRDTQPGTAVQNSGWAIASLLQAAEMQEDAEYEERLKAKRKEIRPELLKPDAVSY